MAKDRIRTQLTGANMLREDPAGPAAFPIIEKQPPDEGVARLLATLEGAYAGLLDSGPSPTGEVILRSPSPHAMRTRLIQDVRNNARA